MKSIDDATGKAKKLSSKNIYALVVDGKAYVATDKAYFRLHKENDEFLFDSDGTVKSQYTLVYFQASSSNVGVAVAGGLVGGLIGGLVAGALMNNSRSTGDVTMIIDHMTGDFITVPK